MPQREPLSKEPRELGMLMKILTVGSVMPEGCGGRWQSQQAMQRPKQTAEMGMQMGTASRELLCCPDQQGRCW